MNSSSSQASIFIPPISEKYSMKIVLFSVMKIYY